MAVKERTYLLPTEKVKVLVYQDQDYNVNFTAGKFKVTEAVISEYLEEMSS